MLENKHVLLMNTSCLHLQSVSSGIATRITLTQVSREVVRVYYRGGQLDQLREPHFSRQKSARAIYSMLKFIKSKYCSVLTGERLTELVRTVLTTYQPNFKKLTAYQELCYSNKMFCS
jgi:hypothetical protein